MSIGEIKEEAIRQFVTKVEAMDNYESLQELLTLADSIGKENSKALDLSRHYDFIKAKYSSLFYKFVQ